MLFSVKEYKIVVVGLDNAGKTKSLYKLYLGDVITTHPPIGSNVEGLVYKNIRFEFIPGFSSVETSSMVASTRGSTTFVILVFANKQDIKDAKTLAEITDALSLRCIKTHDWHIQACCALTGYTLYYGLWWKAQHVTGKATS
ncbi:hypothetical protein CXB51_025830 [Gossypium anomalum]|uniref:Uncharacterized protein n=1 Tax=Gossypium anomalum TaxID=47600 RepID=A0A8J6CRV7_9ROSI|nr:hypothetical protein CXB51_025830 [Gossypium anomalum]